MYNSEEIRQAIPSLLTILDRAEETHWDMSTKSLVDKDASISSFRTVTAFRALARLMFSS